MEPLDQHDQIWLQRIARKPDDLSVRWIYADWLEERGDTRAELLRLNLQAQTEEGQRQREAEQDRLRFLRDTNLIWLEADCIHLPFEFGFQEQAANLGVPIPPRDDLLAGPSLARNCCQSFDFTNSVGMRMRLIPPGRFRMGSDIGINDEAPVHEVRLTQPFFIASNCVTQGQWCAVMNTRPWRELGPEHEGPRRPAINVSYTDALDFCRELSSSTGQHWRLPTEAEWEYACRAGTNTSYSFGNEPERMPEFGWAGEPDSRYWMQFRTRYIRGNAHDVGQKKKNAWQIFDMHGNVDELCADRYGLYSGALATDPSGPEHGIDRVIRGGNWNNPPLYCRSSARADVEQHQRAANIGFRLAADANGVSP